MANEVIPQGEEEQRVEAEAAAKAAEEAAAAEKAAEEERARAELEEREPGGDDPQAVRARKEYRARKAALVELQREREQRIALEARLQEREKKEEPKEKVFTVPEIQTALDEGRITQAEAIDYIARQRAKEERQKAVEDERKFQTEATKLDRAANQIEEYRALAPWLDDQTDRRRNDVAKEYKRLVLDLGMPDNIATQLVAVEKVVGPISRLKARSQISTREDFHSEPGVGGGSRGDTTNHRNGTEVDRMPQYFKDFWNKMNTPQADREKEAKIYFSRREYYTGKTG